jgi:hypothetical protein
MKLLAIHYSQSGQLTEVMENILKGFDPNNWEIDNVKYHPKGSINFPWTKSSFFDAMPECVLNTGVEIDMFQLAHEKYDLILFGYQPWFLSPSLPSMGILKDEKFRAVLQNSPVITVIGARNMWINAQSDVKTKFEELNATLIGNIPLIDKSPNLLSAVSIMHWVFTGRKERKWNIFPKPGIDQEDIDGSTKFGKIIDNSFDATSPKSIQNAILASGEIDVSWAIIFIEERAKKLFTFWAKLIIKKGTTPSKRKKWLLLYRFYLLFALFIVSPIVLLIYALLFRPFFLTKEKANKKAILSV